MARQISRNGVWLRGRMRTHASGAPGRRPSLNELVREKLLARPLDADIDRGALVDRAMKYLDEAQAVAPTAAVLES